jgi:large subunit ribosomal protein L25
MANNVDTSVVEATPREAKGKNEARRSRKSGHLPGVVYGAGQAAVAVTLNPKQIARILHSGAGHNSIFDLQMQGEQTKAMIVEWQYEPLKGALLHVDLKRIAMDQKLRVKVPIHLSGEAVGVKQQSGILEQVLREVELECLPGDIPGRISVDVSGLAFGQAIRVSDLPHGEGALLFLTDEDQVVAHVVAVKEVVEAAPEVAAATPETAEPEVIKRGKAEAEEGAAGTEKKPAGAEKKPEKK